MTASLQLAFDEAAKLPEAEQDLLASWLMAELAAEDDFDRKIASTSDLLVGMARKALADDRAGGTRSHELNQRFPANE